MRTIAEVLVEVRSIEIHELRAWVAAEWVRPEGTGEALRFSDADLARVRLVHELRHELAIDEETVPLVLSMMDQLYESRFRLRAMLEALQEERPEVRRRVLARYARALAGGS